LKSLINKFQKFVQSEKSEETAFIGDFYYGTYALNFLTFCWLFYQTYIYVTFSERPTSLFAPINYFQKLFMPTFPPSWVYFGVIGLCFILILISIKKSTVWTRALITFSVLYLNALTWSYEFNSHVTHILILGHLLKIFIPHDLKSLNFDKEKSVIAIKWYYAGILVTYTFSGLWKVVGLVYKFLVRTQDVNWIDPEAMQYNAIVSYRTWDLKYDFWVQILEYQPLWQILFVIMVFGQVLSVCFVFRKKWLYLGGLWTAMFHLANIILFKIIFVLAPIAVLTIFMPWLAIKNRFKTLISTSVR